MVRKYRLLIACAAALILLGAVIWGFDARRNHPTSRPELSTYPSVVQAAAQVTTRPEAAPTLAVPSESPPANSVAADAPPATPVLLVPVPNQSAGPPPLPTVDTSPELVRVTGITPVSPASLQPAPPIASTQFAPPQDAAPPVPSVPLPAPRIEPPPLPSSPQQADSGAALALTPPPEPPAASVPSAPTVSDQKERPCPWNFQVAVVKGRTQLEARSGTDVQFVVTCDHLTMQTPTGQVRAEGNVGVHGLNVEGSCEKLTLAWHDDNVLLEGKVRLKCKQEGQDVDLTGEQLSVKLAVVETVPPPAPLE